MREHEIQPGVVMRHVPTQAVYRIEALGKIRLPDGEWVEAARYINILRPEGNRPEYYRPLTDFGIFALEPTSGVIATTPTDSQRLRVVLATFGKRDDNMPLTQAERNLLAAFDDRGSYTDRMKLGAIDAAVRATAGVTPTDGGQSNG